MCILSKQIFLQDYEKFHGSVDSKMMIAMRIIKNYELRYLFWGRKYQFCGNKFLKQILRSILNSYRRKYGLEMHFENIGGGLRLIHPFAITVNALAKVENDVTLYKGCTIGSIECGRRKGTPIVEDGVTLFTNCIVCGNIKIGRNAIIGPGAFVNFDVPENSIVIGNPGCIHENHNNL